SLPVYGETAPSRASVAGLKALACCARCGSARFSAQPAGVILVSQHGLDETTKAKLLLILLALIWGMSWPIMKIALDEVTVWTLRGLGYSISAVSLFALIRLQGRSAAVPYGAPWLHIIVASVFNVVGFGLFSSFAQLTAATSRVVIINYSMPVWASLVAWLILGERLTPRAWTGLVLCIAGLPVLVY